MRWVTDFATTQRLAPQPVQRWTRGAGPAGSTVVVDPTRRYQSMTGFGASMTDTSAWLLTNKLSDATRRQTMNELFSPTHGIGLSMLRQPMGASDHYNAYARYFVKFLNGYRAAGLITDYVSVQNEPLYEPGDYPGMGVPAATAAEFIGKHLGPAFASSGLKTKTLAYDHSWDVTAYPEAIHDDPAAARYVPGTGGAATNLSRAGWTPTASSSEPGRPPPNLLDGDLGTRWSSGAGQAPGTSVSIDLGASQTFNQIVYNKGRHDARVELLVTGFDYTYWLPPAAAVTFAVSPAAQ